MYGELKILRIGSQLRLKSTTTAYRNMQPLLPNLGLTGLRIILASLRQSEPEVFPHSRPRLSVGDSRLRLTTTPTFWQSPLAFPILIPIGGVSTLQAQAIGQRQLFMTCDYYNPIIILASPSRKPQGSQKPQAASRKAPASRKLQGSCKPQAARLPQS